ncbi:single-stranded-DNA-specific exonuclease RecJ, partial [Candidatus Woesearchaeota archaeon]|nr:single-stranded-DNA-specific exonuclease RecJ [Candidatus Woesearchaeota archaeon]
MLHHPVPKKIISRCVLPPVTGLEHLPPLLQRIYAARQLASAPELDRSLARLPSPFQLKGMTVMVEHLEAVIRQRRKLLIVADYDADGATACCVALLGLALLGAEHLDYLVPSRFGFGYGLTPELVRVAA